MRTLWKLPSSIWEQCSSRSRRGGTPSLAISRPENKGFDEGMTPPELLLASLGSCAAFYAVDYLVRNKIEREGVKVRVTAEKVKGPFRLDNFNIEVEVPGGLDSVQLKGLEEAVHRCLIHNTLLQPPKIDMAIQAAGADRSNSGHRRCLSILKPRRDLLAL